MTEDLQALLRSLRVWDPEVTELRRFDPAGAPGEPLALFTAWFAEAVAAGQPEPHTVSLATVDEEGLPDVRTVMLHGADAAGWSFGTHDTSRKGRQLAARPQAALGFYWPALGRQVRLRGPVTRVPAAEGAADLHARSTGALAKRAGGPAERGTGLPGRAGGALGHGLGAGRRGAGGPGPHLDPLPAGPGGGRVLPGRPAPPPRPPALPARGGAAPWARELLWP